MRFLPLAAVTLLGVLAYATASDPARARPGPATATSVDGAIVRGVHADDSLGALRWPGVRVWPLPAPPAATEAAPRIKRIRVPESISIGFPWRGALVDPASLEESRALRFFPGYRARNRYYGTIELVTLLRSVAERVSCAFDTPAKLTVGDLSARNGGRIVGHRSHRNGRDVDLGFYFLGPDGGPAYAPQMVRVGKAGRAYGDGAELRFDDPRNWKLVESFLLAREATVSNVFVANELRERLLREADRVHTPPELLERARRILAEPRGTTNPHRDHFHVRIYCAARAGSLCRDRCAPGDTSAPPDDGT